MVCVPPAQIAENTLPKFHTLNDYLEHLGMFQGLYGTQSLKLLKMAELLANEPDISQAAAARRLAMDRTTSAKYLKMLKARIDDGSLDLSPYSGRSGELPAGLKGVGSNKEYDENLSYQETRKIVQMMKERMRGKLMTGKTVSLTELKKLTDIETTINKMPQSVNETVVEFYDQIFERVPARMSGEEVEAADVAEYNELGEAGDLGAMDEPKPEVEEDEVEGSDREKYKHFKSGLQDKEDVDA